jgi:hypothetical protein
VFNFLKKSPLVGFEGFEVSTFDKAPAAARTCGPGVVELLTSLQKD